ncbi:MAG: RNA polymerase sigma-54 factor, partial [Prevotella sp.]|nr:RNA polymerase sigma-54 factor [Prevotella sp.]
MAQGQIQEQSQQLKQGQSFSHQQLLQASLVELPVTQLIDRINTEMNDNPALETDGSYDNPEGQDYTDYQGGTDSNDDTDDFESRNEREERQSALD